MKAWQSWSNTLTNWLMSVSLSQLLISMVLLMALILSFNNCFSAFLIISKLLGVLTMFSSVKLTTVMPVDKHLSENSLWFPHYEVFTLIHIPAVKPKQHIPFPNSRSKYRYRFLILFVSNYKKKIFLQFFMNRKLLECKQAFTRANNMALSGLWENIIITKINTYHIWPIIM